MSTRLIVLLYEVRFLVVEIEFENKTIVICLEYTTLYLHLHTYVNSKYH